MIRSIVAMSFGGKKAHVGVVATGRGGNIAIAATIIVSTTILGERSFVRGSRGSQRGGSKEGQRCVHGEMTG